MGQTTCHTSSTRTPLQAQLVIKGTVHSFSALLDSGADESFIDSAICEELNIPLVDLEVPLKTKTLSGELLALVTKRTEPLRLHLSGNHQELISFFVLRSPDVPLILGMPWFMLHNPHVDWKSGTIRNWSVFCHSCCLKSALGPNSPISTPSETPPDLTSVPPDYHDVGEVFSKQRALSLPPHRPYDCAIELLPDAPLPGSRLFNLSRPELKAMEDYIQTSLTAGLIRPSSSPV